MLSGILLGINLKASNGITSSFLISIGIVFRDSDTRQVHNELGRGQFCLGAFLVQAQYELYNVDINMTFTSEKSGSQVLEHLERVTKLSFFWPPQALSLSNAAFYAKEKLFCFQVALCILDLALCLIGASNNCQSHGDNYA